MSDQEQGFRHILQSTLSGIDSLRDFVNHFGDNLFMGIMSHLRENAPTLTPYVAMLAEKDFDEWASETKQDVAELRKFASAILRAFPPEPNARVQKTTSMPTAKFQKMAEALQQQQNRSRTLWSSSLVSLCVTVELCFYKLFHLRFVRHPEAIGEKDKVFSFEDLAKFQTLDEAKQHYIRGKVVDLLRGSFLEWIGYFKKNLGLKTLSSEEDIGLLWEAFQRRNAIVHAESKANSIYLEKVDPAFRKGIEPGDDLTPNRHYLSTQLAQFELFCASFVACVWKKLDPADAERAEVLMHIAYDRLERGRFSVTKALSEFVVADPATQELVRDICQLNAWLAVKLMGRWDQCKAAVEAADYSSKSLKLKLGLAALKGEFDNVFQLIPHAIASKSITKEELQEFPIFAEMRTDERFKPYEKSGTPSTVAERKKTVRRKGTKKPANRS
jgi:hypothetical protein